MKYSIILIVGLLIFSCDDSNKINVSSGFENPKFAVNDDNLHAFQETSILNFDSLIKQSELENKALIIYFSGFQCVNCIKFDEFIFSDLEINSLLKDRFIPISLYVDDKTLLDEINWIELENGKQLKTVGEINFKFQKDQLKTSTQPYFVIYNTNKEILSTANYQQFDKTEYKNFLIKGLKKYMDNK